MKISKDISEALRYLKSKGIMKVNVAFELGLTPTHLSKMISGERRFTEKNVERFNEVYGKHVILELPEDEAQIKALVNDPSTPYFPSNKKMTAERSLLKVLVDDYVALKADITKTDAKKILKTLLDKASEVVQSHS